MIFLSYGKFDPLKYDYNKQLITLTLITLGDFQVYNQPVGHNKYKVWKKDLNCKKSSKLCRTDERSAHEV